MAVDLTPFGQGRKVRVTAATRVTPSCFPQNLRFYGRKEKSLECGILSGWGHRIRTTLCGKEFINYKFGCDPFIDRTGKLSILVLSGMHPMPKQGGLVDDKASKQHLMIGKILLGLQIAYFFLTIISLESFFNGEPPIPTLPLLIPIIFLLPCLFLVNIYRIGIGRILVVVGFVLAILFFIVGISPDKVDFSLENIKLMGCVSSFILIFYVSAGVLFIQSGIRFRSNKIISQT